MVKVIIIIKVTVIVIIAPGSNSSEEGAPRFRGRCAAPCRCDALLRRFDASAPPKIFFCIFFAYFL